MGERGLKLMATAENSAPLQHSEVMDASQFDDEGYVDIFQVGASQHAELLSHSRAWRNPQTRPVDTRNVRNYGEILMSAELHPRGGITT